MMTTGYTILIIAIWLILSWVVWGVINMVGKPYFMTPADAFALERFHRGPLFWFVRMVWVPIDLWRRLRR